MMVREKEAGGGGIRQRQTTKRARDKPSKRKRERERDRQGKNNGSQGLAVVSRLPPHICSRQKASQVPIVSILDRFRAKFTSGSSEMCLVPMPNRDFTFEVACEGGTRVLFVPRCSKSRLSNGSNRGVGRGGSGCGGGGVGGRGSGGGDGRRRRLILPSADLGRFRADSTCTSRMCVCLPSCAA